MDEEFKAPCYANRTSYRYSGPDGATTPYTESWIIWQIFDGKCLASRSTSDKLEVIHLSYFKKKTNYAN